MSQKNEKSTKKAKNSNLGHSKTNCEEQRKCLFKVLIDKIPLYDEDILLNFTEAMQESRELSAYVIKASINNAFAEYNANVVLPVSICGLFEKIHEVVSNMFVEWYSTESSKKSTSDIIEYECEGIYIDFQVIDNELWIMYKVDESALSDLLYKIQVQNRA